MGSVPVAVSARQVCYSTAVREGRFAKETGLHYYTRRHGMVGKQETALKQRQYLGQDCEDTLNTMIMVGMRIIL